VVLINEVLKYAGLAHVLLLIRRMARKDKSCDVCSIWNTMWSWI